MTGKRNCENAPEILVGLEYQLLHVSYGKYIGEKINYFIQGYEPET